MVFRQALSETFGPFHDCFGFCPILGHLCTFMSVCPFLIIFQILASKMFLYIVSVAEMPCFSILQDIDTVRLCGMLDGLTCPRCDKTINNTKSKIAYIFGQFC